MENAFSINDGIINHALQAYLKIRLQSLHLKSGINLVECYPFSYFWYCENCSHSFTTNKAKNFAREMASDQDLMHAAIVDRDGPGV